MYRKAQEVTKVVSLVKKSVFSPLDYFSGVKCSVWICLPQGSRRKE